MPGKRLCKGKGDLVDTPTRNEKRTCDIFYQRLSKKLSCMGSGSFSRGQITHRKMGSWVTEQQTSRWTSAWVTALWYPGEMRGSQLADSPPEQRRGAVIDTSTKTSVCLAVVQKASKMLGITKKGTENKIIKKKFSMIMVLHKTFSTTFQVLHMFLWPACL